MTIFYRGKIVTAEDVHKFDITTLESAAERGVAKLWPSHPPGQLHPTVTTPAIVNHGRWIVPCPWCVAAMNASKLDRRFFCVECGNGDAEGRWVRVVWPDDADDIEELLAMRPDPKTRNWAPGETLAQLLAENDQHEVH